MNGKKDEKIIAVDSDGARVVNPKKLKRKILRSSDKTFKGSKSSDFYGEGYFLKGEGSNYGRTDEDGKILYAPYVAEAYLFGRRQVAREFLRMWPKIDKALVLGCARGYFVQALRELGVEAVGIDISEWATENCYPGLEKFVYQGDVCDLRMWPDKYFDLVLAFDVLEHIKVPDLITAIDEAVRVGDMVIVDVPIAPDDEHPDQSAGTDASHVSVYSQEWWISQFMERGHEYFRGRAYFYPEVHEESPWPDGRDHAITMYFRRPRLPPTVETAPDVMIMPGADEFRILWWSNAPWAPTGYGVGTSGVVYGLAYHYDMGVLCSYGLEGRVLSFSDIEGRNPGSRITVFPKYFHEVGVDAAELIVENWRPNLMITLFDIWVDDNPVGGRSPGWISRTHPYWVPYFPVDHDPCPYPILAAANRAFDRVAMSQFGQRKLEEEGISSHYIPHGVDVEIFKPAATEEQLTADREFLIEHTSPLFPEDTQADWSTDDFIIGINAANKDEKRKGFQRMFKGIQRFLEMNPDAQKDLRVHLHTDVRFPGGINVDHAAALLEIAPICRKTHSWHRYAGLTPKQLARVMRSHSLGMNCSWNEGFGIPIIEWEASKVPVMGTDFTSMTELIKGHGYLVKPKTYFLDSLMANAAIPDVDDIARQLGKAYNKPKQLERYGRKAHKFAQNYDWKKVVVPLWEQLIEDFREKIRPQTLEERWIKR